MPKIRDGGVSYTALDYRYYTKAQLNSTTAPSGASLIGVADAGGYFAGADVEAVLQEIAGVILPGAYLRLDGTNVPTANYNWTTNLVTTGTISSTGFQISGAAVLGTILRGNGVSYVPSTNTFPDTGTAFKLLAFTGTNAVGELAAVGATGKLLQGTTGAIPVWTTATYPTTGATTTGAYLRADGTNWIMSTLILPNAITDTYVVIATATNTYGSDAGLTYNDATDLLTVTNSVTISGGTVTTNGLTLTGLISQAGINGVSSTSGSTGSITSLNSGSGGAGSAGNGGAGGNITFAAGSGGTGTKSSTTVTGGAGSLVRATGSGGGNAVGSGTCTLATGGKGSSVGFYTGVGGTASNSNTASTGGAGGDITLSGYTGGTSTAASGTIHIGGAGTPVLISAGDGGAASGGSVSNTGGDGGNFTYTAGIGGTGATANGANGKFIWKSGATEIARFDNTAGAVGNFRLTLDNQKIQLGTAQDALIYYDGTNLVINPKSVGTGYLSVLGDITATGKGTFGSTYQAVLGDDVNTKAGSFVDGTRTAELANDTWAGYFTDGIFQAGLGSSYAGWFYDGGNQVYLADGTYAINATGNIYVTNGMSSGIGYTGDLNDSTSAKIADVVSGIITAVYY